MPTEPSSTFQNKHQNTTHSSLTATTPAVAVLFVVGRRMLVYHVQPLDSGAVPLLMDPPFVSITNPGTVNGLAQRIPLDCFAVR